jgi:chromosome segregation ATPase
MSENGTPKGRFGRRALTGIAVLSIAALGAAWSGCGDDEDEVNDAIENANEQIEEATDEALEQAEETQDEVQQQIDEGQEEAQEAQDQAEQQIEDAGGTTTTP